MSTIKYPHPSMTRKEFWEKHDQLCKAAPATQSEDERKAHMDLHRAYYAQWAQHIGKLDDKLLERCALALANGDAHMNSPYTSLKDWDGLIHLTKGRMRESDGCWSLSFNTCVLKEAARQQLEAKGVGLSSLKVMGREFTIVKAFTAAPGDEDAVDVINDWLVHNPGTGVLHQEGRLVYIASMKDGGKVQKE